MSQANIAFVIVGAIAFVIGVGVMTFALRQGRETPKGVALLIAGMMATAFGMLMAGFALAVSAPAEPAR